MTVPLALLRNDGQEEHFAPGHPERPDRVRAVLERIRGDAELAALPWLEAPPGDVELPRLVHTASEVAAVQLVAEAGGGWFDADTYCTESSYRIALDAAACAARAAEAVAGGEAVSVFAVVRPPGHHATPDVPMGFCLFGNAAIAVRTAQRHGVARVAIVDVDVHHGNGTQDMFWDDPDVLYCSLHEYPFFPGSGAASERGGDSAAGTTVNVPLPAGTDGAAWLRAFDEVVAPAVRAFAPELVVVSAGFDAHADDPLAGLALHDETYTAMAERIRDLAEDRARGRMVWLLEGG
ncbi:MAG: histone deacetylase, partial [Candidatus Dormibacteraeota bacterium]|nr:histone deacetylase [Candidatus Dormibacteraeota bacterium]